MTADLGWSSEKVTKSLEEVQNAKLKEDGDLCLIAWDEENEIVLITNGLIKDRIAGPKQIEAAVNIIKNLPSCPSIFSLLLGIFKELGEEFKPLCDTLSHRVSDRVCDTLSIPPGYGYGKGKGIRGGSKEGGKPTAKERRLALFAEAQQIYPQAHNRHLAAEVTGRNAYTADLKDHKKLGFDSEAELHAHVLNKIRAAVNSSEWEKDEGKYIPGIGKWFKNRLWRGEFVQGRASPYAQLSEKGRRTAQNAEVVLNELWSDDGQA
jgi:hypothetical protein